ncbi:PLP-dependent aminotransferase family protein [Cupriavidus taiwanensis]|uniref:aminotransferase-like domain-containing protein n=1 Tax=Cupriavidus taiwanensis TaxID=164546 RepID=UPI000E10D056|nr:PLP-dependent aminotransferase family protein [Cupriavidus taiwanensis]SOY65004.1 AMINO TRANSFERASE PROTEIN [Cupriavidus taiwanensis]SOY65292.1 AMINO TRANSFERASE PROTEIN [Cupriavidus taiwanensis]SOY94126.1 AMINO TRANSFERASE PROTEIN [Cupriavidus taiwanensis]SOZ69454.1 AMINO TRANSFERASE PROTEIN [Cupriavidus taiwanensis]SOZ85768.1 AMINO TRANSFERASE PROTEIN [Cupriavidus taiwanensis]
MTAAYPFVPALREPEGSPIRELFKYLSDPEMISFAGGYPSAALFDADGIGAASAQALRERPAECLQYGATEGAPALRDALGVLMAERGAAVTRDQLLVTSGSQQGFDFLVRALVEPGSVVLVEEPTYSATLQALRLAGADVRGVPSDQHGMDVDALAAMLADGAVRPRLIYTVPTFANPTGATLSPARRLRLLELAARHQVVLVEDDPYGALSFDGAAPPSLLALCDQVPGARPWLVHLASLSKTLAPGLRIGWMVAAPEIIRRAVIAKQVSDLCTPPWLQLAVTQYLADGRLPAQVEREIACYRDRRDRLAEALRLAFGERIRFGLPAGGMFLWAALEDIDDAAALLPHAIAEKVLFVPGAGFYAQRRARPAFRLSFAGAAPEQIAAGVARLKRAALRLDAAG